MSENNNLKESSFFLSDIIGKKVFWKNKKIGKLSDIVVFETEKIPEATHILVSRAFGYQSLLIPWKNVIKFDINDIRIDITGTEKYEIEPRESQVLLKDHILDKKILDTDDNEIEVVYDIKLVVKNKKLYVTEVDSSKYGLLKRIGLNFIANFIYSLANKIKTDTISWAYVQPLPETLTSFEGNVKLKVLKEKLPEIHPVDLADILEELDPEQRLAIFNELDTEQASDTLEEIEPRVQRDLIASIEKEKAAELINDMTPGQAADILAILPSIDAEDILNLIDQESRGKIEYLLEKHDENILNFATSHFFKFNPDTTVSDALREIHTTAKDKDVIMYMYIANGEDKMIGVVDIRELLQAEPQYRLESIMTAHVISLNPDSTLMDASRMFSRYLFRAIPVTDENDRIQGVIPYKDIMTLKHRFI